MKLYRTTDRWDKPRDIISDPKNLVFSGSIENAYKYICENCDCSDPFTLYQFRDVVKMAKRAYTKVWLSDKPYVSVYVIPKKMEFDYGD